MFRPAFFLAGFAFASGFRFFGWRGQIDRPLSRQKRHLLVAREKRKFVEVSGHIELRAIIERLLAQHRLKRFFYRGRSCHTFQPALRVLKNTFVTLKHKYAALLPLRLATGRTYIFACAVDLVSAPKLCEVIGPVPLGLGRPRH